LRGKRRETKAAFEREKLSWVGPIFFTPIASFTFEIRAYVGQYHTTTPIAHALRTSTMHSPRGLASQL
jgi:hypothetical protein